MSRALPRLTTTETPRKSSRIVAPSYELSRSIALCSPRRVRVPGAVSFLRTQVRSRRHIAHAIAQLDKDLGSVSHDHVRMCCSHREPSERQHETERRLIS